MSRGTGRLLDCRSWILRQRYRERYNKAAEQKGKKICASEGRSRSSLTALLVLVGAIAAVVGAVAHPVGGDAVVVGALKLAGCAEFVCGGGTEARFTFFFQLLKGI